MDKYDRYNKGWYLVSKLSKKSYKIIERHTGGVIAKRSDTGENFVIYLNNVEQYYKLVHKPLSEILKEL